MMSDEIIRALKERGIVLSYKETHFCYSSGKHGEDYIDKSALLAHSTLSGRLVQEMVMRWIDDEKSPFPEVIVGPAMSGAILAHLVAHEFNRFATLMGFETTYASFADKDPLTGIFKPGRGYDKVVRGRKVLVVEDVINTGGTVMATAHAAMMAGGVVIGINVIWNRGDDGKLMLPNAGGGVMALPIKALVHHPFPSYTAEECLMRGPCSRGIPLNRDFGHGAEFLAKERKEA